MSRKIVVIGGVALGPKAASRITRMDADAEVTLVDAGSLISYGGCGIPYYISGDMPKKPVSTRASAIFCVSGRNFCMSSNRAGRKKPFLLPARGNSPRAFCRPVRTGARLLGCSGALWARLRHWNAWDF